MKFNKEIYGKDVLENVRLFGLGNKAEDFLKNMVHIGFGVEQHCRGVMPSDYRFYCKSKKYLKEFIESVKRSDEENIFNIIDNEKIFRVSSKFKRFSFKSIEIYKGKFNSHSDFFEKVDLEFDFNEVAYDFQKDEHFAKNRDLFNYRVENYNSEKNYFNDIKEIFCEDSGGEWAAIEDLPLKPIKRKVFKKVDGEDYYELVYI